MKPTEFCELAGRLLRPPVAPYHEQSSQAEVERICEEHELDCERDRFGNLFVQLRTARHQPPLAFAAHLDHPGFEIVRKLGQGRWLAQFIGGVADHYFRAGTPLRLMPGSVPAKLEAKQPGKKRYQVHTTTAAGAPPEFAVWELPDFEVRRGNIVARACDDLAGSAAALATLIELKRSRAKVNVLGVFSRAEEDGFRGALTIAGTRRLPRNTLLISLETSRELPPVRMGRGVIIRVGDKSSIFDSDASRFLHEVALGLQGRRKNFRFQRALMSGGTCEATAYQEFGIRSAAVCVALGNYHNCGPRGRIAAEFINVTDACGMVELLVAAAKRMPEFAKLVNKLPQRLRKMLREARQRLR